ncbi:hypothetical protein H5410_060930 [Solanum commersonii]|uniref:Polyprotein protein n=1 Tax=Solanum commersonii TaxID=4109 RepID=A0A9J5W7G0_SOLCO|nr:hypothetical protein H5410_060930 [Solanum commersonii]
MLITEMFRQAQVPRDEKKNVETLPAEVVLPTLAPGNLGTSSDVLYVTRSSFASSLPLRSTTATAGHSTLTQEVLLRMGQLAYYVDRRAARLEATIPSMIKRSLANVVTPLSMTVDSFVARIAVCEQGQGATNEVMTLKVVIAELNRDILDVPVDPEVPLATTEDEIHTEEVVFVETDEEQLGVDEKASYEGLMVVEEDMVDAAIQISLVDTPTADPTRPIATHVTPGTDAHDQNSTSDINALKDRETM